MQMTAYRNDASLRSEVLQKLADFIASDRWDHRPLYWDGTKGSIVGQLIQGDNVSDWEAQTGLPAWVGMLADMLVFMGPDDREALRVAVDLLGTIEGGQPLERTAGVCVLNLLTHPRIGLLGQGIEFPEPLQQVFDEIVATYRRFVCGDTISDREWRAIRRRVIFCVDDLEEGSMAEYAGRCIEAAAWNPTTSFTVVADSFKSLFTLRNEHEFGYYPWSSDDYQRLQALSRQVIEEAPEGAFSNADSPYYMDVVHRHDPVLVDRYYAFQRHRTALAERIWRELTEILFQAFRVDHQTPVPLRPRSDFFAHPQRGSFTLSGDGQWLAWTVNHEGAMNVWVAPRDDLSAARQVTFNPRGISGYSWAPLPGTLVFMQDKDGDGAWKHYIVDLESLEPRELLPGFGEARIGLMGTSRKFPGEIVVSINDRDPNLGDIYRVSLTTGERTLIMENPGLSGYLYDDEYNALFALERTTDGGTQMLKRSPEGEWHAWLKWDFEDARMSGPSHLSADGRVLYAFDSRERDTAALVAIDVESGESRVVAEHPKADIAGTINDLVDRHPLAYGVNYTQFERVVLDDALRDDVAFLDTVGIGEWNLADRSDDDRVWLVMAAADIQPGAVYIFDRDKRDVTLLHSFRPELDDLELAPMTPVIIPSRDGLELVSLLSVPPRDYLATALTKQPLPLVLLVHGGPWTRDSYGYSATHQWLANRGYAVLAVNFRGSIGFGKAFINAGDEEWGGKMDDDLIDAVNWAVEQGIADPQRVAIMGASYGGYAVLSGLTRFPDTYACGIDIVGPANLETLLQTIPSYWKAALHAQYRAIGDPATEHGRKLLRERSPVYRAGNIRAPLLIGQGGNDPRVNKAESEQMVAALKRNEVPVIYAYYPDEGHGFGREANVGSFNGLVETFLARHLGGRAEPWSSADYPGTSLDLSASTASLDDAEGGAP
ncbi:X-Pro dipeptidyl-peptidase (S15 family) [Carnimonas sp. R-84865]